MQSIQAQQSARTGFPRGEKVQSTPENLSPPDFAKAELSCCCEWARMLMQKWPVGSICGELVELLPGSTRMSGGSSESAEKD